MMGLCCAIAHAILVFQASEFERVYLPFARNLPYGRARVYGQQVLLYGALLLPELAWLVLGLGLRTGLPAAGLLLGLTLLLHNLLYQTGPHMPTYLRLVSALFFCVLLANLFGLAGPLE